MCIRDSINFDPNIYINKPIKQLDGYQHNKITSISNFISSINDDLPNLFKFEFSLKNIFSKLNFSKVELYTCVFFIVSSISLPYVFTAQNNKQINTYETEIFNIFKMIDKNTNRVVTPKIQIDQLIDQIPGSSKLQSSPDKSKFDNFGFMISLGEKYISGMKIDFSTNQATLDLLKLPQIQYAVVKNTVDTFDINIKGSLNIMEIVRNSKFVKSTVIVTSDKCYENVGKLTRYKESDTLGGIDPYSASKSSSELIIRAYRESFFRDKRKCGISSARAGNVIGGGDWSANRLIPDGIRSLLSGKSIYLRNPKFNRPWQHVLDPLMGYLCLAEKQYKGKIKDLNKILSFMLKDKKNHSDKINLVLLKKIGSPIINKEYSKKALAIFLKNELTN